MPTPAKTSTPDTKTIERAVIETLAVKERLLDTKIVFYVQHRLGRQKLKATDAAVKAAVKALLARGAIQVSTVRGRTSYTPGKGAEVRAVEKDREKKAASRVANAKAPLDKARCYVLARTPDVFPALAAAIEKRFSVVKKEKDALSFEWKRPSGKGPTLRLVRCERAEVRRQMGGGRYSFRRGREYASFAAIAIDDLDAVLDEANTFIEAQMTLAEASQGLLYNAWNHGFIDGAEVTKKKKAR